MVCSIVLSGKRAEFNLLTKLRVEILSIVTSTHCGRIWLIGGTDSVLTFQVQKLEEYSEIFTYGNRKNFYKIARSLWRVFDWYNGMPRSHSTLYLHVLFLNGNNSSAILMFTFAIMHLTYSDGHA